MHTLLRFVARLRTLLREWDGDAEYERYTRICMETGGCPLDRGRYYAERLEERYRTNTRCC